MTEKRASHAARKQYRDEVTDGSVALLEESMALPELAAIEQENGDKDVCGGLRQVHIQD